jgi:hypothetical protein
MTGRRFFALARAASTRSPQAESLPQVSRRRFAMRSRRSTLTGFVVLAMTASAIAWLAAPAVAGPITPVFSPANFTPGAPIDNPFFPLVPGTTFRTRATLTDPDTGETSTEIDEDFVTFQTDNVAGVPARVVRARSFLDGLLIEDTTDRYAQDKSGNVWYLGEQTTAFVRDENGKIVNTDTTGSWRTGVHGATPGFIMPVDHTVGFNYRQEFAPADEAVDQGTIVATDVTIDVPAGHFTHVLKTKDFSDLQPGVFENKYYAPGVGLILTEDLNPDGSVADRFALVSVTGPSAIPLPPAVWPGLIALVTVAGLTTTRRRILLRR